GPNTDIGGSGPGKHLGKAAANIDTMRVGRQRGILQKPKGYQLCTPGRQEIKGIRVIEVKRLVHRHGNSRLRRDGHDWKQRACGCLWSHNISRNSPSAVQLDSGWSL